MKEVKVEKEVNYVGVYVYDTQLQNDVIHKMIWETLKNTFKEAVEEFTDGSTYNKKSLSLGGSANLRNGLIDEILDKGN